MTERFQNLIDGKLVDAANGTTFEDINPANKTDVLGTFPRSDHRDVDRAVEAARVYFPQWRRTPAPRRATILFRAAESLAKRKEEFAKLMTREMGKLQKESLAELQVAIDLLYFIAGEGQRLHGEARPSDLPDKLAMMVRVPLGVVAAISPWNFPLAIPIGKLAPALVAGNTVVFKPSEDSPLMAVRFVELLLEAGLPPGAANLVHGYGEDAGAPLTRHPEVELVSFTGSSIVGREVAIACAAERKRVSLEVGGELWILVMEDADLDLAVDGTVWGGFGTSGRSCAAASRILVHKKVMRDFADRLVVKAQALRLGDGLSSHTDVGPLINDAQLKRVHAFTRIGLKEGAKLLCGGEIFREGECKKGFFYTPTVFGDVSVKMRIAREEIVGPTVSLLPVGSIEEAIEAANTGKFGLCCAIYTRDINRALQAVERLGAGITCVNAPTIGAEAHLPFGGIHQTGNGYCEGGRQVVDAFTAWKTVYIDYSGKLRQAAIQSGG